jgi:hypothetical protein
MPRQSIWLQLFVLLLLFVSLLVNYLPVSAQTGNQYALTGVVVSGGDTQSGRHYNLTSAVGQPAEILRGGPYRMTWSVLSRSDTSTVYLPLVNR